MTTCVMILSTRSAGSSALQAVLEANGLRHVSWTQHQEHETLFWTNAASALGLPQVAMADSVVPLPAAVAIEQLRDLLAHNAPGFEPPADETELVYEGWRALAEAHGPNFVEKSPHHLHQWSALELAMAAESRVPDVDHVYVGLVRHPIDCLYSMWTRWRFRPEIHQHEWATAYRNLLRLSGLLGDRVLILRYEDFVQDPTSLEPLAARLDLPLHRDDVHSASIRKWADDPNWGFTLDSSVVGLAEEFGYAVTNPPASRARWLANRELRVATRRARRSLGDLRRRLSREPDQPRE